MEKNLTIRPEATIRDALKALNQTAKSEVNKNVLMVVDAENRFVGTLTDGDVRRSILDGHDLKGTIAKVFNPEPIYVYQKDLDIQQMKQMLSKMKITLIPVVNEKQKIVDYYTWEKAFGKELDMPRQVLDVPVVIMAGGKGDRLEPFTKVLPKPLIPINEKPVIEHIIDRFVEYGVREFWLTVNYKSRILKAFFEEKQPYYSVNFIEESKELGTAGSLKYLSGKINRPFFVKNCDIIINTDYADLLEFHQKGDYSITLVASVKHYNIPYGICELNGEGYLDHIKEKPEYSFLVNTGLYLLNPDILKIIPENEIYHITQLIEDLKRDRRKIGVYPVGEEVWIDIGQWAEYKKAIEKIDL
jgi:dTDP-glucose pyrophosphorylase|tara:strand:+ start:907 stop:1980 length:1074 start_codon:yes stop_codon:yes gene_type:complete